MSGPPGAIELFHGYTYSAHPLACAAGIATLQLYKDEGLFERAAKMAPKFEQALHSLKGVKHVIDIRNIGLVGGVELAPRAGAPGRARLRDLSQVLRARRAGAQHRRHHRARARPHRRGRADRPASSRRCARCSAGDRHERCERKGGARHGIERGHRQGERAGAAEGRLERGASPRAGSRTWRPRSRSRASAPDRALAVKSDVGDPESVKALFAAVEGEVRPPRPALHQRGHGRARGAGGRAAAREVAPGGRRQPERHLLLLPGGGAHHEGAAAARRAHHPQRIDLGARAAPHVGRLYRDQARDDRDHEDALARPAQARHRGLPDRHRQRRHRDDRPHGPGRACRRPTAAS